MHVVLSTSPVALNWCSTQHAGMGVGTGEGRAVGPAVGAGVGSCSVGTPVGTFDGARDGSDVGLAVGTAVGAAVGDVGTEVGAAVGTFVSVVGEGVIDGRGLCGNQILRRVQVDFHTDHNVPPWHPIVSKQPPTRTQTAPRSPHSSLTWGQ